ncbi:MAG: potassium channel family protein [Phycisphaerales bacterium]|nr:potassium channel family protein [Phycisphaerales bacterium]
MTHQPRRNAGRRQAAIRELAARGAASYSATHFLIALGILTVVTPIVDRPPIGDLVAAAAFTLVAFTGTLAVRSSRRALIVSIVLGGSALACAWLERGLPGTLWPPLEAILAAIFSAFIAAQMLLHVVRAERVQRETVCAGLATYMMLGVTWMFAYLVVDKLAPGSFAEFGTPVAELGDQQAFYLSFVTLTTTGYGDITPRSSTARTVAVLEAIAGSFFVMTILARLVSAYTRPGGIGGGGSTGSGA